MFKFLTDLGVTSDSPHFFLAHPAQVSRWLDEVWLFGPQQLQFQELPPPDGTGALRVLQPFLGDAGVVTSLGAPDPLIDPAGLALTANKLALPPGFAEASPSVLAGKLPIWHHLIYAYLLENTGMFEIFAEVVRRATSGETLEISGQPAVQWVRNTEELFFRDPPLFSVGSITSHIRPDERVRPPQRLLADVRHGPLPRHPAAVGRPRGNGGVEGRCRRRRQHVVPREVVGAAPPGLARLREPQELVGRQRHRRRLPAAAVRFAPRHAEHAASRRGAGA